MKARPESQHRPPTLDDASRKPYSAPAILSREKLEVFAVVCSPPGKGDPAACPAGPINS
jgi:hypothetical protein